MRLGIVSVAMMVDLSARVVARRRVNASVTPSAAAAAWVSFSCSRWAGSSWVRNAMREARGTASLSSSSFLPARVPAGVISTPVRLASGLARLFTSPMTTGSKLPSMTIGTAEVAALAARVAEIRSPR
jgi:hypothetical protein